MPLGSPLVFPDKLAHSVLREVGWHKTIENQSKQRGRHILVYFGIPALKICLQLIDGSNLGKRIEDARIPLDEWVLSLPLESRR